MGKFLKTGGLSQRQLRVGEEIRHILADVLRRESFPGNTLDLALTTITEVRASPDLRHARVFVMTLGAKDLDETLEFLNKISPVLRSFLAKRLTTKFTPKLFFTLDNTYAEAEKIDIILKSAAVAKDLKP